MRATVGAWTLHEKTLQHQHRNFLAAEEGRDAQAAQAAVKEHILWFYRLTNIQK